MLSNYIKIGWRNILKYKFYSCVNIIGLTSGIAFTFLIGAYIWGELQVNSSFKNAENQYIIQSKWKDPNMGIGLTTLAPLAKTLKEQYPDLVANYYRIDVITSIVSKGDKHFNEELQIGDSTFLNMYGFPLLQGNEKSAFSNPYSIVITEEIARKYFARTNVVGETLSIENFSGSSHDFVITGVLQNPPDNSVTSFDSENKFQIFLSANVIGFFGRDISSWNNPNIISFVELNKGITAEDMIKPIKQIIKNNTSPQICKNILPYLVPLKTYYRDANNGLVKKMVNTLLYIVTFILLMAVINFINLSTSRSDSRLKEIGVRKILGSIKKQLIFQFLIESIIVAFLSTIFAAFIYEIARHYFESIVGKNIPELMSFPAYFIFIIFLFSIIIGLLAGFYPSFIMSLLKPVDLLKRKTTDKKEKIVIRKLLVGFQFSIAAIVFISGLIITQQISFYFGKDLGYNKDYVITTRVPRDWSEQGVLRMETIRDEIARLSIVGSVSLSYEIPNGNNNGSNLISKPGQDFHEGITFQSIITDDKFPDTYQIPMVAGCYFNDSNNTMTSIVINETAAKALKWTPQEAIGNLLNIEGSNDPFRISGVIKDFHFSSMQEKIQPIWFRNVRQQNIYRYLSIKIKPGNINNSIMLLQKKWSELLPGAPFEYKFMDKTLEKLYTADLQLRNAVFTGTILALVIALLGIIGLISLSLKRRAKEIGIRKVLGSSIPGIIILFINEFVLVILSSIMVACPVAYLIMKSWLNNYAYKIDITVNPFLISISFIVLISILLIIVQTFKTANENPMKSLKAE